MVDSTPTSVLPAPPDEELVRLALAPPAAELAAKCG